MSRRTNLLDHWDDDPAGDHAPLGLVRLDANQVAVVPFTSDSTPVTLHYCDQPEVSGYVHCNGVRCVLCRAGRAREERVLLPVYLPAAGSIAVLPISPSSRPGALWPQVLPVLRSGRRVALLISRPDRAQYRVGTVELEDGIDDGAAAIAAFVKRWEADEVDLASVYPRLEDRDLAAVPGIAAMLRLKGLDPDDVD